jgi:hypothetical protein
METKFLSLRHPVELGSRFDDWQVCWLGGWDKHRHFYLVMLVKVAPQEKWRKHETPPVESRRRKMAGSAKVQTSTE